MSLTFGGAPFKFSQFSGDELEREVEKSKRSNKLWCPYTKITHKLSSVKKCIGSTKN
jgi:hypothetical protein